MSNFLSCHQYPQVLPCFGLFFYIISVTLSMSLWLVIRISVCYLLLRQEAGHYQQSVKEDGAL